MDNMNNQSTQKPKYIEIAPNGQVIRQETTIPPEVVTNYLAPQDSMSNNSQSFNNSWSSNGSHQYSNKRKF